MKVHIYFEILSIKEVEKVGSYKWSNLMGESNRAIFLFSSKNGNLSYPMQQIIGVDVTIFLLELYYK